MSLEKNEELHTINAKKKPNKGPYLLGESLGEGAFAKVRLATQIHIKEKCAIKIVDKRLIEGTKDIQRLKKEIKILKSIRHKNIIQLFDIMESKTNLYFVLEYCKGGELFDYIVKNKRLKEGEACKFFQQIINGVEYLHNQGIIHRDLKPENLLLDYKNNIKISDFGLSTFFSKNNFLQTACGTPFYAPPEMLEGLQYNGEASDIWSCGIILYAMLCGTLPFSESKEEIIVKKIKSHDYIIPDYLSKEAQDILYHILQVNPEERFTIEKIKQHPWFNLVKPHLMKGISLNKVIIPVDDNILNMVQEFGFDKEECRKFLLNNKFCCLTSIYYLCLKKFVREGGKSVSDLESDLFEKYINDPNNYIQQDKNNENKENKNISNKKDDKDIKSEIEMNSNNKEKSDNKNNLKENQNNNENNKIVNETIIQKKENINGNVNNPNINKEKINSNSNVPKTILIKINQTSSQKKQNTKIKKKKLMLNQNNQQSSKYINNIQDKNNRAEENLKNINGQIESKIKNIDSKINSPIINKTKNFIINLNQQNNINTISNKKKLENKKQNKAQAQLNTEMMKSPQKYLKHRKKMNTNYLINSFVGKNKSLEKENYNNNKLAKIKSNKNIKNKKSIKINNYNINVHVNKQKLKNINNSNTNNKILSPKKLLESNIGISPIKNSSKNIYQNNKSSLLSLDVNGLDKEFDENKFIEEQKPLNIINYIAKKLVSSSFFGNYNLQYSSDKKFYSGRMLSAKTHNHYISNDVLLFKRDSNPINEEIEYIKENNIIDNDSKEPENLDKNKANYNDNFYFKNLISILNQKFKKYAPDNDNQDKYINTNEIIKNKDMIHIKCNSNKINDNNQKQNVITISNKKANKSDIDKPYFINSHNNSNNLYPKKIFYKEDSDFKSLDNKKSKNNKETLSPKNNNIDNINYNIKDMTTHYNNFLDISTNYDPGIDSRGGSSVERTDSMNKNELKNFSLSLDKKTPHKNENGLNDKNQLKSNKFKKDFISEQDKSGKNKYTNKNNKNKYMPFYEKKVSINLSNTFSSISKSENKNKKK